MNKSILGRHDAVVNEKRILELGQYKEFLRLLDESNLDVDLSFMNELNKKDIPQQMIENFNFALLECKRNYNFSLVAILAALSEEFMDVSKIKKFIMVDVMWELIHELRHKYPNLQMEFPSESTNITDLLF